MMFPIKSLFEMTKGRLREFRREPSAFFFVLFMPIFWMVILGLTFSDASPEHYRIGLAVSPHPDQTHQSIDAVLNRVNSNSRVSLHKGTLEQMETLIKKGEIELWIETKEREIQYVFDRKNPSSEKAHVAVNNMIQEALGRRDQIATSIEPITVQGQRYIDFLIPGLLALSLFTTSLYGTGMTLVVNRREKLLKRYKLTPMSESAFFLSHLVGRHLIAFLEALTILATGMLLFEFKVAGDLGSLIAISMLGTAAFTAIGILCGSRLDNAGAYSGLANLVVLPMMLLSGTWYSRSHFPGWLQSITEYLPLTALTEGLRKIAIEGASFSSIFFQACILLSYFLFFSIISKRTFRWH